MRIFTRTLFVLALLASSASAQYVKVEEADGTPKTTATKIILPNGTLSTAGSTATLTFSATAAYVYIAYASDASGTGFTTTFNSSLDYIAVKATTSPIASPSASDFTGLWKNYKGTPGIDGSAGTNGTNGATWHWFASGTPSGGVNGDFAFVVSGFEVWYRSAGVWTLQGSLSEASTLTVTGAATVGSLVFEGSTADDYETTIAVTDPTASDKTITLPNLTGTVALTSGAQVLDWGGATSLEIPNANDPTVDAEGEIAQDANNDALEIYTGAESRLIPTIYVCSSTFADPDGLQAIEDAWIMLPVESTWAPFGITIKDIYLKTDASSTYSITLEEWTAPDTASSDIETVATSTSLEAEDDGTLTDASVAAGSIVMVDLPTTAANMISVTFTYIINPGN